MSTRGPSGTIHKLTTADIKTILEELANEAASKWYQVGIQLEVSVDQLNSLRQQNSSDDTAKLCCVLLPWLKSGKASWEALCKALESSTVGEKALADKLREGYCTPDIAEVDTETHEAGTSKDTSQAKNDDKQQRTPGPKRLVRKVPQRFCKGDFVQTQKSDRFCSKCRQVPYTPQRSVCCNQLYCDICSTRVTKCPKCKGDTPSFKKDSELYSKIQKVKIKCPNEGRGCTWKGEVYKLKNHLSASECSALKGTKQGGKEASKSAMAPGKASKASISSATGKTTKTEQNKKGDTASTSGAKPNPKKPTRKSEISTNLTPPLHLVMEDVSYYKNSGEFWLSDSFLSHQLGYRLSLAVKLEPGSAENHTKVTLALMSAKGKLSHYLDYPCIGNAAVIILNPEDKSNHEKAADELMFMLESKDPQKGSFPALNEQTEIGDEFIRKDSIFFRVDKVEMNERPYKLWLLDPQKYK